MTPLDTFKSTMIAFIALTTPVVFARLWWRATCSIFKYDDAFLVLA
jgi:hypothetical protein